MFVFLAQNVGGEMPGPWMIEVVGHYLYPLVGSTAAALILEAAKGLLQLTALAKSVSASGEDYIT